MSSSIVLDDVCYEWADGSPVLDHVTATFPTGRTGLIGANGAGKSTLLRLLTREIQPTSGTVAVSGSIGLLRQGVADSASTLAELTGVAAVLAAIAAIETGSSDPALFDLIGDDWDIEARIAAELAEHGLPTELDRSVRTLSGGEAMLAAIIGVRLRSPAVTLLDEPTNNLDAGSRAMLHDLVARWRGTLIVVSHDTELLDAMDGTAELRGGALTTFGGPLREYREYQAARLAAADQALRAAEQRLKKQVAERAKAEERIAHSERQGRIDRANRKYVPAAINDRRNSAEKAQGARRSASVARVDTARQVVKAASSAARRDPETRVTLPDPGLPPGRRVLDILGADGRGHILVGPERVAITGANGVGKTTLLRRLLPTALVPVAYVPQRLDLDPDSTALDIVAQVAPGSTAQGVRSALARLLIRGDAVSRTLATFSGGELLRVVLARAVLADPTPELLVLDEPTNSLDLAGVEELADALADWRGALIVVSHDAAFLRRVAPTTVLRLDAAGLLSEEAP